MPRSSVTLTAMITAFLLYFQFALAAGEPVESSPVVPERLDRGVTEAQYLGIVKFLELVNHPGIHFMTDRTREQQWHRSKSHFSVDSQDGADYASIVYDNMDEQVIEYLRESVPEDLCAKPEVIVQSREQAFRIVGPVIRYYSLPDSIQDYDISETTFLAAASGKIEEAPAWEIRKDFTIQELPCRNSFFSCCVSAARSIVVSVVYFKVPAQEEPETVISGQQAREYAEKYRRRSDLIRFYAEKYQVMGVVEIRRVFARPNEDWAPYYGQGRTSDVVSLDTTYLCWEVPFDMWSKNSGMRTHNVIWITMESGKPAGGGSDKWRK